MLGPLTFGRAAGARYLESPADFDGRNFSEHTAQRIDSEVRAIVGIAHQRARDVLEQRRPALERIAQELLVKETLERADLLAIVEETAPPLAAQ